MSAPAANSSPSMKSATMVLGLKPNRATEFIDQIRAEAILALLPCEVDRCQLEHAPGIVARDKRGGGTFAFLPEQVDEAFGGARPPESVWSPIAGRQV